MTIAYADNVIADRLQALTRALDAGTGPGKAKLYTATRPAVKGAAITSQVLLATNFFLKPSSDGVTGNVLAIRVDVTPATCVATGICTWARLTTSEDVFVADIDAGTTGSGKEMELNQVQLYLGGEVSPTVGNLVEI